MSFLQKIKIYLKWERTKKPEYNLDKEFYALLKPFRLPFILLQLIMMIGTLGYIVIDDFNILDAIYQTGITFTTVGFGEIAEISQAGRLFTITLIIFGFSVFSLSTAILIDTIVKGRFFDLYKERRMLYRVARLKKHYVIFYHNEYTVQLTKQFLKQHIPFVVVDSRDDLEDIAKEYRYPYFTKDEPYTERTFLKSQLSGAKGVISLSKNISDNITIIASVRLFEKELEREPYFIISSAENENDMEKLKKLGANRVVAAPKLMAKRVTSMAMQPELDSLLEDFINSSPQSLVMQEINIPINSWIVDKKLRETHLRDVTNVSVVGIRMSNKKMRTMPKGSTIVEANSKLLVMGNIKGIKETIKIVNMNIKPKELKYV